VLVFEISYSVEMLTLDVEALSLVHQRHHLLCFGGNSLEPAQTPGWPFGLFGGRLGQQVIQVLSEVISLWKSGQKKGWRRRKKGKEGGRDR